MSICSADASGLTPEDIESGSRRDKHVLFKDDEDDVMEIQVRNPSVSGLPVVPKKKKKKATKNGAEKLVDEDELELNPTSFLASRRGKYILGGIFGVVLVAMALVLGLVVGRGGDDSESYAYDVALATDHMEILGNITKEATSGPRKGEPQANIKCNFMKLTSQECTLFKKSLGSEGMLVVGLAKTTLGNTLIVTGETSLIGGIRFDIQLNVSYYKKKATVVLALFPVNPIEMRKVIKNDDAADALAAPTLLWSAVDGYVYAPVVGTKTPITLSKGLSIAASFIIERSPEATQVAKVLPLGGTIDLRGSLYPTFKVAATIPAPLTLVKGVTLKTCEIDIAPKVNDSSVPPFQLQADLDVVIPDASFELTVDATLHRDMNFTLDAKSVDEWTFAVGSKTLNAKDVHLLIDTTQGLTLNGDLTLGDMELVVSLDLPTTSGAYTVHGHLSNNANINMQKVTAATAGQVIDTSKYPSGLFGPASGASFLDADFYFTTQPPTVRVTGNAAVFSNKEPLSAEILVQKDEKTKKWGVGFALMLGASQPFSDLVPSIKSLDHFAFANGALVFSTFPASFSFNGLARPVSLDAPGVKFDAQLGFSGSVLGVVQKWTHIEAVDVSATFGTTTEKFTLTADIVGHWNLGTPSVAMTDIVLSLAVGGTEGVQASLATVFEVYMSGGRTLQFTGSIALDPLEVTVDAAMTTDYTHAFGLDKLTIDHSELLMGFNVETGVPVKVGIGGGFQYGTFFHGDMDVLVDVLHPANTVFYAETDGFSLDKAAQLVCGTCSKSIPEFFTFQFGKTFLKVNPGPTAVSFNQEYFPPGAMFSVSSFQISTFLMGSASVSLQGTLENPTSVAVRGDFNETDLFNLGVVKIAGSSGKGPFHLDFTIDTKSKTTSEANIDASVTLLGAVSVGIKLSMSQTGMNIQSELVVGKRSDALLSLVGDLVLVGSLENPTDFSFSADFNSRLLDFLSTNSTTSIHNAAIRAHEKLSSAEAAVQKWENEREPLIARNKAKIAAIIADDERALAPLTRTLQHAKADLMRIQSRVDSLQREINSYNAAKEHCSHWYSFRCHAHNAWEDGKIAAVWVVKTAADAALITAEEAVRTAAAAADHSPDLDPRVIALVSENAAIKVAGTVAKATLKGADYLQADVLKVAQWADDELAKNFNIQKASCSIASLKDAKNGKISVKASVTGRFFGKEKTWTLPPLSWPPTDGGIASKVLKAMHDDIFKA